MSEQNQINIFRSPWEDDFPDVIVHGEQKDRDNNPDYLPAKGGNIEAAYRLVDKMLSEDALQKLMALSVGKDPLLASVSAIETMGINVIPDAMSAIIYARTGLQQECGSLRQINKVAHTKAGGFWRIMTPAEFGGRVIPDRNYILIDDHIGHGGTLANLRGYILHHGGHVIGMTTLTKTRDAQKIRLEKTTLDMLRSKHGQELETLWNDLFHYGLDCLTDVEGGYLCGQSSIDTIRGRMAAAAEEARTAGIRSTETS